MFWILYTAIVLIFVFSFVLFFGAPYVPTLKKQQEEALDLLDLKPGQTLIDVGSGDGRMLRAAAKRGIKVVGYELNPFLYIYSMARNLKYRELITINLGSYWRYSWPEADGIYVFLLAKFMPRLDTKINREFIQPVKVVSFAFEFPGRRPTKVKKGLRLYEFKSNKHKPLRQD